MLVEPKTPPPQVTISRKPHTGFLGVRRNAKMNTDANDRPCWSAITCRTVIASQKVYTRSRELSRAPLPSNRPRFACSFTELHLHVHSGLVIRKCGDNVSGGDVDHIFEGRVALGQRDAAAGVRCCGIISLHLCILLLMYHTLSTPLTPHRSSIVLLECDGGG